MTAAEVHRLGHNLPRIAKKCEEHGLHSVADLHYLVRHLAEMNSDHDFRYPTPFKLTLPTAPECLLVMDALVAALGPTVEEARLSALFRASGAIEG